MTERQVKLSWELGCVCRVGLKTLVTAEETLRLALSVFQDVEAQGPPGL